MLGALAKQVRARPPASREEEFCARATAVFFAAFFLLAQLRTAARCVVGHNSPDDALLLLFPLCTSPLSYLATVTTSAEFFLAVGGVLLLMTHRWRLARWLLVGFFLYSLGSRAIIPGSHVFPDLDYVVGAIILITMTFLARERLIAGFLLVTCLGFFVLDGLYDYTGYVQFLETQIGSVALTAEQNEAQVITAIYDNKAVTLAGVIIALLTMRVVVSRQAAATKAAQAKTERLLSNVFPDPILERIRKDERPIAEDRAQALIVFIDLVNFTLMTRNMSPKSLVAMLDCLFSRLDAAACRHDVEKVKTVGDGYLAAAGLTARPGADDAQRCLRFAMEAQNIVKETGEQFGQSLTARIGLHKGATVAGVMGSDRSAFDVWGEAVNIAARIQASAWPGEVRLSEPVYGALADPGHIQSLGSIDLKGVGTMKLYRAGPGLGLDESAPPPATDQESEEATQTTNA